MKKLFVLLIAGIMVFSFAACGQGQNTQETPQESTGAPEADTGAAEAVTGGWTKAADPTVTDEVKALVEKATAGLDGASYTPVAYIGSQVVAGTNHRVLCTVQAVTPDAAATYVILTIYEDLEGNAEITGILESKAEAGIPGLAGGWNAPETPVVTPEAQAALEKALEGMVGAEYTPIALLATQVVSGTNYSILCEITAVTPDAEPGYSVVHVYEDLQGNAEITDTFDFTESK